MDAIRFRRVSFRPRRQSTSEKKAEDSSSLSHSGPPGQITRPTPTGMRSTSRSSFERSPSGVSASRVSASSHVPPKSAP